MRDSLNVEELRTILRYEPETGNFYWVRRPHKKGGALPGALAGYLKKSSGYRYLRLFNVEYSVHRLAWFYVHGVWPPRFIDHIDRNPLNNAITNLRPATDSQNRANSTGGRNNSGIKGVYLQPNGRWLASIGFQGKSIHLGRYDTKEEAARAYAEAARHYYGEFAA